MAGAQRFPAIPPASGLCGFQALLDRHPDSETTIFRQHTVMTFVSHLTAVRVERAKVLLRDHRIALKELAALVGYAKRSYFDKVFSTATGQTPGKFRAGNQDGN